MTAGKGFCFALVSLSPCINKTFLLPSGHIGFLCYYSSIAEQTDYVEKEKERVPVPEYFERTS